MVEVPNLLGQGAEGVLEGGGIQLGPTRSRRPPDGEYSLPQHHSAAPFLSFSQLTETQEFSPMATVPAPVRGSCIRLFVPPYPGFGGCLVRRCRWRFSYSLPGLALAQGGQGSQPPGFADYGKWETLSSAGSRGGLSPDGRWIAYAINRTNGENELRITGLADGSTEVIAFGAQAVYSVRFQVDRLPHRSVRGRAGAVAGKRQAGSEQARPAGISRRVRQ